MGVWLTFVATGFVAGAGHVFAGPDHLAAVAPITLDGRRRAWLTGLLWGVGHSGGVWVLALLALALRELLPLESLSAYSERVVGVVLIAIGLWGMRKALTTRVHAHEHEHDGVRHRHIHMHDARQRHDHRGAHQHKHVAVGIGLLHGLAGTSHLLGVLPTLLMPDTLAACGYVVAFGLGSIAAMTAFSWLVGFAATRWVTDGNRGYRWLMGGCCVAAVAVGVVWLTAGGV